MEVRKEDSSFSEEKEAKRLLFNGGSRSQPMSHPGLWRVRVSRKKVFFASFFFRKKKSPF
jgi:hypothetical protein